MRLSEYLRLNQRLCPFLQIRRTPDTSEQNPKICRETSQQSPHTYPTTQRERFRHFLYSVAIQVFQVFCSATVVCKIQVIFLPHSSPPPNVAPSLPTPSFLGLAKRTSLRHMLARAHTHTHDRALSLIPFPSNRTFCLPFFLSRYSLPLSLPPPLPPLHLSVGFMCWQTPNLDKHHLELRRFGF